MLTFHLISIFPNAFDSYLQESIIARAMERKHIAVKVYNPRDFTIDKHKKVDHIPYGGGPGMVMTAQPILATVEKIKKGIKDQGSRIKIVILSARGKEFTNEVAKKYSKKIKHIILICGRYEGIDERVKKILKAEEVSIGNYVLTGGELAAMVMVDSISRQIEGVLGKFESLEENRITSGEVYTRPEILNWKKKNYRVPKVLLSGHHKNIEEWRSKGKKK